MSTTLLRKLLSIPLVVIFMLGAVGLSWAGPPTDQLRAYTDQVLKILEDPSLSLPDRRTAVRKVASEAFDVSETAKRALGSTGNSERRPSARSSSTSSRADLYLSDK